MQQGDVLSLAPRVHPGARGDAKATLDLMIEQALDLYARLTPEGAFVAASDGLVALLGYSTDHLATASLRDVVDSEDVALLDEALHRLGRVPASRECVTVRMIKSVTQTAWVELRLIRDADGRGVLFAGRDLSEHKRREEELQQAAAHDALTGLPNRALLSARIAHALAQHERGGRGFALAVADLDGFKRINDSLGHATGDAVLTGVAGRLKGVVRGVDTIARVGGDEFVLVLHDIDAGTQVESVARRLTEAMQLPFVVGEHTLFLTLSIGFALYPAHASNADALMHCADAALYRAKDLGRNRWQIFSEDFAVTRSEYLKLEQEMFEAVRSGQFLLHYQPIAKTDGTIVGAEALMRWPHPARGMVSPAEFIPIAESNGLIALLGGWALRTACMQVVRWDVDGAPGLSVSVNVSARQFRQEDFHEQVRRTLSESGIAPARLVLEITESTLLKDPEQACTVLEALERLGVRIAVDDFGTGYSSLAYLKRFPLSTLKIDRSFVRDMGHSASDRVIVSAVLSLARELGLEVVAEGVEDAQQLRFLTEKGCSLVQGYYIGRPMAACDLVEKARASRPGGERA